MVIDFIACFSAKNACVQLLLSFLSKGCILSISSLGRISTATHLALRPVREIEVNQSQTYLLRNFFQTHVRFNYLS